MTPALATAFVLAVGPVLNLPTALWQVAPDVKARFDGEPLPLKKTKPRAVLLVHGLNLHPLRPEKATKPEMHDWQQAKSDLVKALAADFDVYAFGYAQTVAVDAVSASAGLAAAVAKLRKAEYADVTVIGHSAGGIIGRLYAEANPDGGVAKVIQVGSPNAGSDLANIGIGLPKTQIPFIKSLAPKPRVELSAGAKPLPEAVAFCCVVCKIRGLPGDSMVSLESQWPDDLRRQGVPAALVAANHFEAMKAPQAVKTIAELAREKLVRWTPEQVEQGRVIVFSKDADAAAVKRPPRVRGANRP